MEPKKRSVYMTERTAERLKALRKLTGLQTWAILADAVDLYAATKTPDSIRAMQAPTSSRVNVTQKPASGSEREFWQNK